MILRAKKLLTWFSGGLTITVSLVNVLSHLLTWHNLHFCNILYLFFSTLLIHSVVICISKDGLFLIIISVTYHSTILLVLCLESWPNHSGYYLSIYKYMCVRVWFYEALTWTQRWFIDTGDNVRKCKYLNVTINRMCQCRVGVRHAFNLKCQSYIGFNIRRF